ncbi:hypothetical protein DVA67_021900 [Solirubrobacter sp. CPCC 204708]|uniref:Beta-1,6-N-acetylglucosaminyltransferase n=1 Tax=Solirubrobacter deserti TaxID=2282478 RepID=A0ABT4RFG1_9ACTN|nr:beta-1,6-N-acetylglucosaminyltransferase [Solirubrobacter deserti]MBE2318648.1 hypothetical protein [Solirubrobacter deserti]MDA0137106.1 beta-1,6-N-acetylglucosaminyltransferase [Solirubrobacter deserti]
MTTVYVVLSHQYPDQVLRLVRTLRRGSPACTIVLHHDDRRTRVDEAALRALGVERVLPATPVGWGGPTQLQALRRSLRQALRGRFEWLTVISGQDYPLRPLADIERRWRESGFDAFVEGAPVAPPAWTRGETDEFGRRYFYRYRQVRPPGRAVRRAVAAARPLLTLRDMPWGTAIGLRRRGPGVTVRRGTDWLTLSRRAAELVAEPPAALLRYYERAIVPTESLPHTALYASGLRLSGDPLRFSTWSPGAAHPAVLGREDLDAMLASGADFARKFEPGAPVLDELDRVVLG